MAVARVTIALFIFLLFINDALAENFTTEEETSTKTITTTVYQNTTTPETSGETPVPLWAGFVGCLIASIFFGSNLLPVKQFSAGDGFFFQFVFCVAVWLVGLILDLVLNNQRFYPLVLIGGKSFSSNLMNNLRMALQAFYGLLEIL